MSGRGHGKFEEAPVVTSSPVTWVVEPDVFGERYRAFGAAIVAAGHERLVWDDLEVLSAGFPRPSHGVVVFHGSLGTAELVRRELPWRPGAYCRVEAFACSSWYPRAARWLLHRRWSLTTARDLLRDPEGVAGELADDEGRVFVRLDSPLKPFSGRVCRWDELSPRALDVGYRYDDLDLPVIVAPAREIDREWRFVIVDGEPVAASGYVAEGRAPSRGVDAPWEVAAEIAAAVPPPEPVYVMDLCRSSGEIRLVEWNPFSGADLYACDPDRVVAAVSSAASSARASEG